MLIISIKAPFYQTSQQTRPMLVNCSTVWIPHPGLEVMEIDILFLSLKNHMIKHSSTNLWIRLCGMHDDLSSLSEKT